MHAAPVSVLAGLLLAGCGETPRQVVYDLTADAHVARQLHPGGVRTYISPPETVYSEGRRAARREAQARLVSNAILELSEPLQRELRLQIERPRWGTGEVVVVLNSTPLGTLVLEAGRQWYSLSLPAEAQRRGANRLRLTFPGGASGERPPPVGPPVRLHQLSVGSPVAPSFPWSTDARPRFDKTATLIQPAGTGLEFAIRLPEAAELSFTPRLAERAAGPVLFRVELTAEAGPARELFSKELSVGEESSPVRVPLPGEAGELALLGLRVESSSDPRSVGEWVAPLVLGRPVAEPAAAEAPEHHHEPGDLRRRFEEASVLLIVLDAAAAKHFGCYGYERDTTPQIDRLAAEGFLFEHAYSPIAYTGLAMASLWTSQYPDQHHHGVRPRAPLPAHRIALPELLGRKGMAARAFIANVVAGEMSGLTRGFTEVQSVFREEGGTPRAASIRTRVEASLSKKGPGRSLFYAHFLEPHFPYDPPPPFDTLFGPDAPLPHHVRRDPSWFEAIKAGRTRPTAAELAHFVRLYDGNLAYVDHEIGLLREWLEEQRRWDDLIVILTADHGEEFQEHGSFGHGWHVYEESIRIPLIVKLPGRAEPRRLEEPVDLIDLGATVADILGVLEEASGRFQGRSLLPLLGGELLAPRVIYARDLPERSTYSSYDGRFKLIHGPSWGKTELYDLQRDPNEQINLVATHPALTEFRRQALYRWLLDLDRGDPAQETETAPDRETQNALRALGYVQ